MDHTPVYIIGGHFGGEGGGSGWAVPIVVALLAAGGTFISGLFLDAYKRAKDSRALAAALASEIFAISDLFSKLELIRQYRNLFDTMENLIKEGRTYEPIGLDPLDFPPTVYEKNLDKIGGLGVDLAAEVVWFYNLLNGFRSTAKIVVGEGPQTLAARGAAAAFVANLLNEGLPKAVGLHQRLRAAAARPVLPASIIRVRIKEWLGL